jgi:hypothetical protein
MKPNTYTDLHHTIENATIPVLVVITIAENCKDFVGQYGEAISTEIGKLPLNTIGLVSLCFEDAEINFPSIQAPALYYFLPKNQTQIFWRGQDALHRLQEDLKVIQAMHTQGLSEHDARFTPEVKADIEKVDTMLEGEELSVFPSVFQQGRNLAKEMWNLGKKAATLQPLLVEADVAFERLNTCQACPEFEPESSRCKKCGCGMKIKSHLQTATCPLQKWAR